MLQNIELIELDKQSPEHLEVMFNVRTHLEVALYLRGAPPSSFEQHQRFIQQLTEHRKFYLIKAGHQLSGYCQWTDTPDHLEIGMALHPQFSNKGLETSALALFLEKIQKKPNPQSKPIILFVKKDILRAMAVYQKFGFSKVGEENAFGEYLMRKEGDGKNLMDKEKI